MTKLVKKIKAQEAEKVTFDNEKSTESEIVKEIKNNFAPTVESEDSDSDEEPETVLISTSKAEIISQIKSERDARRIDREKKRQKVINLQTQNRQSRLRKAKEIEAIEDEIAEEIEESDIKNSSKLAPLPENILQSAFLKHSPSPQQIRFESENENEDNDENFKFNESDVLEAARLHRASTNKRRLIETLPYAVVEVGVNGKSRISKAEIKARRSISQSKIQMAGLNVRRIDSVLDRARKTRSAAAVFSRQNSFY